MGKGPPHQRSKPRIRGKPVVRNIIENRDNYKRWPWASFLVVGISIGSIFFLAGSPNEITQTTGLSFVLSLIFLILGSILLLPSVIVVLILFWYCFLNAIGTQVPERCQCLYWFAMKNKKVSQSINFYNQNKKEPSVWTIEGQFKRMTQNGNPYHTTNEFNNNTMEVTIIDQPQSDKQLAEIDPPWDKTQNEARWNEREVARPGTQDSKYSMARSNASGPVNEDNKLESIPTDAALSLMALAGESGENQRKLTVESETNSHQRASSSNTPPASLPEIQIHVPYDSYSGHINPAYLPDGSEDDSFPEGKHEKPRWKRRKSREKLDGMRQQLIVKQGPSPSLDTQGRKDLTIRRVPSDFDSWSDRSSNLAGNSERIPLHVHSSAKSSKPKNRFPPKIQETTFLGPKKGQDPHRRQMFSTEKQKENHFWPGPEKTQGNGKRQKKKGKNHRNGYTNKGYESDTIFPEKITLNIRDKYDSPLLSNHRGSRRMGSSHNGGYSHRRHWSSGTQSLQSIPDTDEVFKDNDDNFSNSSWIGVPWENYKLPDGFQDPYEAELSV